MTQPTLLEDLRRAHMGNYGVILSLLGCLDFGLQAKKLVDRVIDASKFFEPFGFFRGSQFCYPADHVTNLREDILIHRLRYSMTSMDEAKGEIYLSKARRALEK